MHFVNAAALLSIAFRNGGGGAMLGSEIEFGTVWWYAYAGISCFLVLFAGIMSGLTLGLMSLSRVDLEILQRSGTPAEKTQAGKKMSCFVAEVSILLLVMVEFYDVCFGL